MDLKQYTFYGSFLKLSFTHKEQTIYLNQKSGLVFYRYKIDTVSNVKHPGIYLGVDAYGVEYYIHNHYETKKPTVVTSQEFSKGLPLYTFEVASLNRKEIVICNALNGVIEGKPYEAFTFNCQSFVNQVCNNVNKSEDVNKWVERVLIGSLLICGVTVLTNLE